MGILIVNPNPVFDRTITLVEMVPGAVMRTLDVELTAGGKGINVARVLRALGRKAPLLIPIGVDDHARYRALLDQEGAECTTVAIPGGVRTASIYLEQAVDRVTVVNDAGFPMALADWSRVCGEVRSMIEPGDIVLCMGSFPPGLASDALAELIDAVHAGGAQILVDTAPAWLEDSLSHGPDVITPNLEEAEATLHSADAHVMDAHELDAADVRARAQAAALALAARSGKRVIVTGGSAGVAMACGDESAWVAAFPVVAASTVGAGDSFVAGLAHEWARALSAGEDVDWARALRMGVAASAASCEVVRAGGADAARVAEILEQLDSTAGVPS